MSKLLIDPNQPAAAQGTTPALDLGPGAQPLTPPSGAVIKDSDTDHFMEDVIEASKSVPVIVDFWAPWCGPCKTLGPMLEKLVKRAGGLVKMVKINVDENQGLAGQLRVQSIPAVFAFKDGRPVNAFAGALPESQIQTFLDQLIGDAKPPIEAAMEQAAQLLAAGDGEQAEAVYTAIFAQDSTFVPALAGLIRAITLTGDFARATELLDSLEPKVRLNVLIEQAASALELAQQAAGINTDQVAELEAKVSANPKDFPSRFDLALALFAQNRTEDAIDHLLEMVRLDREWNEQAARKQLIKIFDTLGGAHPLTQESRRRLSAVLFS